MGRPLADGDDASDVTRGEIATDVGGQRLVADQQGRLTSDVDELAPESLSERRRRLDDLLEQVVRIRAAVDVAGRDLRGDDLVVIHRELGAVVCDPANAFE